MSKYSCTCGWSISDVSFPAPETRYIITDDDLDGITSYATRPATIDTKGFDQRRRRMLECSQCGRLHLQKAPRVNEYVTYAREVDEAAHVVKLEAALAQLLWMSDGDPGYAEVRAEAEKLLKREGA